MAATAQSRSWLEHSAISIAGLVDAPTRLRLTPRNGSTP